MFNWLSLLNSHGITYTHNRNRHEIDVECPFCSDLDHSQHLGISLRGRGWHCWKDSNHSGKSNIRLVVALLGCSYEQAKIITEQESVNLRFTNATFEQEAMRRMGGSKPYTSVQVVTKLKLLTDFKPVSTTGLCGELIIPYLVNNRKYGSKNNAMRLSERFGLLYSLKGLFSYRIIIPVMMNKEIVNWTARSVVPDEPLRYFSLSDDYNTALKYNLPVATANIKDCLFDYDKLKQGGDTLVICEGPFDAMRITFFGEEYGILGTCIFNTSIRAAQLELLMSIVDRFKRTVLVFNRNGTSRQVIGFPQVYFHPNHIYLPDGIKDPAELDAVGFKQLFKI